jgi:hypothetical protein
MFIGDVGFSDERMCHEVVIGGGDGVRCTVCSGINDSDAADSRDCEDSIDIAEARGERGNANLMELNRLPFGLSSTDLFENAEEGPEDVELPDDVPGNNENAGISGRGCGAEMGGGGDDSDQC